MKKIYALLLSFAIASLSLEAQPCASSAATSSSSNAFTNIRDATNAVAVDNDLNTVLFIHRNNAGTFGGHSGQLRYDVSTNGGATWTNDQGVLNPLSVNGTNAARYPQAAIYNPAGNTNPSNAYIAYMGATVASTFNGLVSGVRQLNGTGNTETYNQPASTQTLIPNSMCKGAPGEFWAIDEIYNGSAATGFRVYKGVWNGSNDIVWSTNATLTPSFNTAYSGAAQIGDFHIAFDPTGQIGWISILTHITPGPSPYAFYPVFYQTTNGGATWSSPMQVDIGQYNCITANITNGNFASTAFESDLTVDVNGEPHLLTTICNGNNAYAVYFTSWHHMFDITREGGLWNAIDIANVNAGRGTWGTAPNAATMDMQPMISRTDDGKKIFFAWSDNSTYTAGQANQTPNLFSCAYDAVSTNWTAVRDFTSCNVAINGQIFFPKMATEVLEPATGQYKLAVINTTMTAADPINTANFSFLDNMTWADADFVTAQPVASVSINEGDNWLLCPGSTLGLSITGSYNQVLWSDNTTTLATTINSPGVYYVSARAGCLIGTDSIIVTGLVANVTATASSVCMGDSTQLSVSGNALNYTWNPGGSTSTSVMVAPPSTTTYTLTAGGDGGCTYSTTTSITVLALPPVAASSSAAAVCSGDSATLTASGALTYNWQPQNSNGSSVMVAPMTNATYTVSGTGANGCIGIDSVSVMVNPLPAVLAVSDTSIVCAGDTALLSASGAMTYSWSPSSTVSNPTAASTFAFPVTQTDYTVTGTDVNGCMNRDTITLAVNALPVLAVMSNSPVCMGDTAYLNVSGAVSYYWPSLSTTGSSVTDLPSGNQNYPVTGTDANGCSSNTIVNVIVNPLPSVVVSGSNAICFASPVTLTASGAQAYSWQPVSSTANPLVDTPSATTTYTVAGTDANGCTGSSTFTVVVNPLPTVTLNISASQVCIDDAPLSLSGTGSPAGGVYSGNGVSGSSFDPSVAGLGAQTISYMYTDVNGCSATANDPVTVNACVGIAEQSGTITSVYPNPFNEQLTIVSAIPGTASVIVYSVLGEEMLAKSFSGGSLVLETASWPAGIYFVTINTPEGKQTAKIVKQ